MDITDALLGEHAVLYSLFSRLEQDLSGSLSVDEIRVAVSLLEASLISHAQLENELLFSELEKHMGPGGPVAVMRAEHDEIDHALAVAVQAADAAAAARHLLDALSIARQHFAKEERVLFGLARQALGEAELARLGAAWSERRKVFIG